MLQPINTSDTRIPVADRGVDFGLMKQKHLRLLPENESSVGPEKKNENVLETINAMVKTIQRDMGQHSSSGSGTMPKEYDQAVFDYVIDRLSNEHLKAIAGHVVAVAEGPIKRALVLGHWFLPDRGWVRDTVNHSVWYKATTGSIVSPRELANATDMPVMPERHLHEFTGFLIIDHAKKMPRFKLIDKSKKLSLGFVCDQTTTFSITLAKAAIEEMDNKKHFNVDATMNKKMRCVLYELLLRKADNGRIFARPVEATLALSQRP